MSFQMNQIGLGLRGILKIAVIGSCLLLLTACPEYDSKTSVLLPVETDSDFNWNLPRDVPLPKVPEDNPVSEAKFQLGRHLFFDTRLSGNQTFSCGSCHLQERAFADGLQTPSGSTGMIHPRNSQALVNIAFNSSTTWANPVLVTLEEQALVPMFGEFPVELGINGDNQDEILDRFREDADYQARFKEVFVDEADPFTFNNIAKALATFSRGLNSFNSDYDRYEAGDKTALSASAIRGLNMFFSETQECFHCHGGLHFSAASTDRSQMFTNKQFHNNGLYNLNGVGDYPEGNQGLFEITGNAEDKGAFRPPTLRNIALTGPYMHDGSMQTLEEVVRHYAAGGRNIPTGVNAGDGRNNPNKSSLVPGFEATEQDIQDLVAFLESLTDTEFTTNPRFSDPFLSK